MSSGKITDTLQLRIEELQHELAAQILDPETIHHEFVSGMHGRKLEFDAVLTASSLYERWIDICAAFIHKNYRTTPDCILGVANGANRLAISIADKLPRGVYGLTSEKQADKSLRLSGVSKDFLSSYKPKHVLVVEDAGTTGGASLQVARAALAAGAQEVTVLNTWQRRKNLERLEAAGVKYKSLIKIALPTYIAKECEYCRQSVKLIAHV